MTSRPTYTHFIIQPQSLLSSFFSFNLLSLINSVSPPSPPHLSITSQLFSLFPHTPLAKFQISPSSCSSITQPVLQYMCRRHTLFIIHDSCCPSVSVQQTPLASPRLDPASLGRPMPRPVFLLWSSGYTYLTAPIKDLFPARADLGITQQHHTRQGGHPHLGICKRTAQIPS